MLFQSGRKVSLINREQMRLCDGWRECFQNQPRFRFSCRKFKEQSWGSRHQDDITWKSHKQFLRQNIDRKPLYRRICIMSPCKITLMKESISWLALKFQKDYWYQSCWRKLYDVNECLQCYRWIVSSIYVGFHSFTGCDTVPLLAGVRQNL